MSAARPPGRGLPAARAAALFLMAASAHGAEPYPAAQSCQEVWSVQGYGVRLGSARETFSLSADGSFSASSSLEPGGLALALGARALKRAARGAVDTGAISRDEDKSKEGKPARSVWSKGADGAWSRAENGRPDGTAAASPLLAIDTLTLERMAQLGWISPGREIQARLFSYGREPRVARVSMPAEGGSYMATADKFTAVVRLGERGRPIAISIDDGKQKLESKLESGGCEPR